MFSHGSQGGRYRSGQTCYIQVGSVQTCRTGHVEVRSDRSQPPVCGHSPRTGQVTAGLSGEQTAGCQVRSDTLLRWQSMTTLCSPFFVIYAVLTKDYCFGNFPKTFRKLPKVSLIGTLGCIAINFHAWIRTRSVILDYFGPKSGIAIVKSYVKKHHI